MPVFSIAIPDGRTVDIEAPNETVALRGAREWHAANPKPEMGWGEYARGLGREALQGLTFDFGDELGLVDREASQRFGQEHPIASTVARVAGGLPLFVAGPGAAAARWTMGARSLAGNVGRSAGLGAGLGAVAGAGAGEGGPAERLASAGTGAAAGGVLGGVVPPAVAGVGAVAAPIVRMGRRAVPRAPTEPPPIQPAGTPEVIPAANWQRGQPYGGLQFVDERTAPALNDLEGAYQMISDWITSAGGNIDDIARVFGTYQEALRLHSSGNAQGAMTLLEAYPPLQRLMRAAASGYREVGDDATRFFSARHTGILPEGSDQAALAQRGIPTRERFMEPPQIDKASQARGIGSKLGDPQVTGQLSRLRDTATRLFTVKDVNFHGFQPKAGATADEILEGMRAASKPAYDAARAAGSTPMAQTVLQKTITPILNALETKARMAGADIRATLMRAVNQFRTGDKSYVKTLEAFDEAKQALDDQIGNLLSGVERGPNKARMLEEFRTELMKAVDAIKVEGLGEKYAAARAIYAAGAKNRDIIEEFMDAWVKGDPAAVLARYDALPTDEARKLARHAMIGGLDAQHIGRRMTQDATLNFDINRADQLLTGLGSRLRVGTEGMRKFGTIINAEQQMVRGTAKTVVGGSMTDRNLQDALSMGVMEIAQNVQSLGSIFRSSQSLFEVGQRVFQMMYDRAFGMSAGRARELSRILLTANPEEVLAHLAKLRMMQPASRMARFQELMQQTAQQYGVAPGAVAGGGIGAAPIPQQSQGPTLL